MQRDNDQDARVLTDDRVIEASKFRRFRAGLGFLDGYRHLSERQADVDIVHGQVKTQDVLDGRCIDGLAIRNTRNYTQDVTNKIARKGYTYTTLGCELYKYNPCAQFC